MPLAKIVVSLRQAAVGNASTKNCRKSVYRPHGRCGLEGIRLHFCPWQKLWFGSVQPSPATLIRVAFNSSNLLFASIPIKGTPVWVSLLLVDLRRFELPTPTMRMWCAPNCATSPYEKIITPIVGLSTIGVILSF